MMTITLVVGFSRAIAVPIFELSTRKQRPLSAKKVCAGDDARRIRGGLPVAGLRQRYRKCREKPKNRPEASLGILISRLS